MTTLPHTPAYPTTNTGNATQGLTKREVMAMHLYAGLLAKYGADRSIAVASSEEVAEAAVAQADALIAALNEPTAAPFSGR